MPIADDWSINYLTKQIYHHNWKDEIGGSNTSVAEVQTVVCNTFANITNTTYFYLYSAKDILCLVQKRRIGVRPSPYRQNRYHG